MSTSNKNIKIYVPYELLNISDINTWKKRYSQVVGYYYKHYSYFHQERSHVLEKLKRALIDNCSIFNFNNWVRLVSFEFSHNPLSSRGSLLNYPGGRFNIGDIDEYKFQPFPALYIAQDFETAFRERYQLTQTDNVNGLTPEELMLANATSFTCVALSGEINQVLDLTNPDALGPFYQEIKNIKLPKHLKEEAIMLKLPVIPQVKSVEELRESILVENWRDIPMQVDIPANSQILGQIAELAGIEGVLYPSTKTSSKNCLAVFPRNFKASSSYIEIKDNVPEGCKTKVLDKSSYMNLF